MGQKVNPHGARVGVIYDWSTRWYAGKKDFANNLVEDFKLRKMLKEKYFTTGISHIDIERTAQTMTVNIFTAKPGMIIGRGGAGIEELKRNITEFLGRPCHINVMESATHVGSGLMEAHDIYVDAQCLIAGEEKILYADKTTLPLETAYDAAKEAAFYSFEQADEVTYKAGECVVLYPVEAHLPCRAVNEPMPLKKAVIKLNYQKLRRI